MIRSIIIAAIAVVSTHIPPSAWATVYNFTCSSQPVVTLVAGNASGTATVAGDTAHLIYVNSNCNANMCTGGQAYIEFVDKAMYAQALAAKVNATNVYVQIVRDTGSTAKGTTANGSTQCKVIALWY